MAEKPGDSMSSETRAKLAADCFRRGSEAMVKQNWDYAIEMYRQAVNLSSSNLLYRQSLRGVEERKYDNNGKGSRVGSIRLMGIRGSIKKARFSKAWTTLEQLAEDGLAINPWDAGLNADMGEAASHLGWKEVAVFAYERAVKNDRLNKDFNRSLAALLEERGEFERAIDCWKRVLEADKIDPQARTKITQLEARHALVRGGYQDAGSTRELMEDYKVAQILKTGDKTDGPGQSPEEDLRRMIRKEPSNRDHYLKLADLLRRSAKLEEAEETLKKAFEVSGGDINIRERLDEIQLERMRSVVEFARDAAGKPDADAETKEKYAGLSRELLRREIEIFAALVERYPADSRRKFELGSRYMEIDKPDLAIPLFQQARADQRFKGFSLVNLGKCFASKKEYSLAKRQFEQAIPEIKQEESPKQYLELYYFLGRVNEKLKDRDAAIHAYQEVLAIDYNYRDTRARVQALETSSPSA